MSLTGPELEILGVAAGTALAALLVLGLGRHKRAGELRRPWLVAVLAASLFFLGYSTIALLKFGAYNMAAEDLGRVDQAIWSVLHGQPLVFSASEIGRPMSRMAGHVELLYLPLAPLFLLWDSAGVLLVAQALIVSLGAWPAYRLGQALGGSRLAVAATIAYLAHPAVGFATLSDIHGDTLAMPFLLLALERAWAGRRQHAIAAMALAIMGKEYVAALAVTAALLLLITRKDRRIALAWALMGLLWLGAVVPALHARHRPPDFPRLTPLYYQELGQTPREVVLHSLRHPQDLLRLIATPRKLGITAMLLAPLGWAALAAPLPLLAAAPVFIPLAASEQLDLRNHHNATLIPFLLLAALLGARRIAGERAHLVLLAASAVAHLCIAPSPFSMRSWSPGRWDYLPNPHIAGRNGHDRILDELVAQVPAGARVTASANVVPHLSHRPVCFTFPAPRELGAIDVALVDLTGSYPPHWRPRSLEIEGLERLLATPGFELVAARDGAFLVARAGLIGSRAAVPCPPSGPTAMRVGPLLLEANGGEMRWAAGVPTLPPLMVLDGLSREVLLAPGSNIEALALHPGVAVLALPCAPPADMGSGRELRVLELREGYPALDWPGPPQPWLPDPVIGHRRMP